MTGQTGLLASYGRGPRFPIHVTNLGDVENLKPSKCVEYYFGTALSKQRNDCTGTLKLWGIRRLRPDNVSAGRQRCAGRTHYVLRDLWGDLFSVYVLRV